MDKFLFIKLSYYLFYITYLGFKNKKTGCFIAFWSSIDHFKSLSNFSCMFLNPNIFFRIWIIIVLIYEIWDTSRNKLKKHSVTKNCSDISLFEWIVLVISSFFQSLEQFFFTVGKNNFGNKIPFLCVFFLLFLAYYPSCQCQLWRLSAIEKTFWGRISHCG